MSKYTVVETLLVLVLLNNLVNNTYTNCFPVIVYYK